VSKLLVNGSGTNVECFNGRSDSKLVGSGVLSCWLQTSCKLAELKCVRVTFVESKQQNIKTERGCVKIRPNLSYVKVATQPAHKNCYSYVYQKRYYHSHRTAPAAKPQGVLKAPH